MGTFIFRNDHTNMALDSLYTTGVSDLPRPCTTMTIRTPYGNWWSLVHVVVFCTMI